MLQEWRDFRRVVGGHGKTKLGVVDLLVMLHTVACNDVSHGAAVDRKHAL